MEIPFRLDYEKLDSEAPEKRGPRIPAIYLVAGYHALTRGGRVGSLDTGTRRVGGRGGS
jgi:hypothetical protein